jgi:Fic family protein
MTTWLYEEFIQRVICFSRLSEYSSVSIVEQYLRMNHQPKIAQINQLKAWLDQFRPLEPMMVAELKKLYDVRLTYNSNAIEGNTLTQSET